MYKSSKAGYGFRQLIGPIVICDHLILIKRGLRFSKCRSPGAKQRWIVYILVESQTNLNIYFSMAHVQIYNIQANSTVGVPDWALYMI